MVSVLTGTVRWMRLSNSSQAVVEELTRDRFFQAPAKLPGREEELEALRQKYNLPRAGMI